MCHHDHCFHQARCGDFHSIKWYKENRRVYVYSPVVDFSKVRYEKIFSQTDKNMLYLPGARNGERWSESRVAHLSVFMI